MRLGYACLNRTLDDCKPNRRTTAKYLKKLSPKEQKEKLNSLLKTNLTNTLEILKFNRQHDIEVYRLSSDIVPLATHSITEDWDYIAQGKEKLREIGEFVTENELRVSLHPGQYTVLNSNKTRVVDNAVADLEYHSRLLQAMGLDTTHKLVLHIGGVYGDKETAIRRFKDHFTRLSKDVQQRLIIENDDKSYTAGEVLQIARDLEIPMVLDVHHFNCNQRSGEELAELLPAVFATWGAERPKLHFSSPRSEENFASHADYINADDFKEFKDLAKSVVGLDFDVMLECKEKDKALFRLREELELI